MPRITPGAQPTIEIVLQSKGAIEKCDMAISRRMIDACIPFNSVNSKYYQPMIDAIASMGAGYKGPNFYNLRSHLLSKNVEEVKKYIDRLSNHLEGNWWHNHGTIFLKSIDASKTVDMLFKLFKEVVLSVGVENIVHIVTDNATNYFPTLFWSPYAAHCINLILQNISKLDEVNAVVYHALNITSYIYNHCFPLYLIRKFTGGREILRPAPTQFATNFIVLQTMATSKDWTLSAYAKESKGRRFVQDVLDSSFWKEYALIVQITESLVRVLRMVNSDDRPSMCHGPTYGPDRH
ncbi:hypothetical protein P3X46_017916 [Hevea brasiliensis]|uniref:DUF659 domain-containing protein n=1 Tax=Hevea brasiliensis TaxID=3981 RepID=A0ABQ9LT51_HEVBR|nr:hypothetical protein P3X46_017916 [Hevea brasiliensis]